LSRKRVVVIEGEDAAPEAVRPSVALIDRLDVEIDWIHPPVGKPGIELANSPFPAEAREAIDASDATLFGATSGYSAPALFYLRWGRKTYANVRPSRYLPGYQSPLARPEGVDLVIVRENLEDMYVSVEGDVAELAPLELQSRTARRPVSELQPGKFALKVITEEGSDRIARFAFELARRRAAEGRPGRVTCGTKHNMLPVSDGLFRERVEKVAEAYPDIELEVFIIDDLAHRLCAAPHSLDVVVLPNLYGDVLSDAAAGLIGGLGLASSGCYGDDYAYFESAHGTAPDIQGKNQINPTATLFSGALMLDYLGFASQARRLELAIERTYAEGRRLTPDQGGTASTTEFCEAVIENLSEA
jgi:isocitrate/isopropylmalate dehydrogenase